MGVDSPSTGGGSVPQTMQAYNLQGTPTLLLIDHVSRLRRQVFGHLPDLELGAQIGGMIAEQR